MTSYPHDLVATEQALKVRIGQIEITGRGGPVRYVIDDDNRMVWLIYASPRHPKDTDRESQPRAAGRHFAGFRWSDIPRA